jgi:hypothetical protein
MRGRSRRSLPKASAWLAVPVVLASVVSACSGGNNRSSSPPAAPNGGEAKVTKGHVRTLPSVGEVIVRQQPRQGTVIRDRATDGKRFFLSGMQAGECLSYLRANPAAAAKDVRAACPGEGVVAMVRKQIAAQARKKEHPSSPTKTKPGQG